MAQSSGGDIIKYGLLAVGGYLLYNWYVSQPVSSAVGTPLPPSSGGGPILPPPPHPPAPTGGSGGSGGTSGGAGGGDGSVPVTPGLAQQLIAAAGLQTAARPVLTADQWGYYYAALPGRTSIPGTIFDVLFFPNGRPADQSTYPVMSADEFVKLLASKGLSGWSWPSFWDWLMGLFHPHNPATGYLPPGQGGGPILPPPPVNRVPIYGPCDPNNPAGVAPSCPPVSGGIRPHPLYACDPVPGLSNCGQPSYGVLDQNRVAVGPIRDASGRVVGFAGLGVRMPSNYRSYRRYR